MSRYDKYNPVSGGFRAPVNAAWTATSGPSGVTDLNRVICVELNGSGRIIKATAALNVCGFVVVHKALAAGDIVDVMTDGEVVDINGADIQGGAAPAAGARLFFDATASRLATVGAPTAGTNYALIGRMVEATRLVARLMYVQG
jgi:hypothetical protein